MLHAHIAHELRVGNGSVLVGVLPRPCSCALLALNKPAVNLFCVYKRNIAVVNLRLLVHQLKNSVCTGKSHNNAVDMLGNLADVVRKLSCHIEERYNNCYAESLTGEREVVNIRRKNEKSADESNANIENVADVCHDRHKNIRKAVRLGSLLVKLAVDSVKILAAFRLVVKDLDDLLTAHHFLNEALRFTESLLLANEKLRRITADGLDNYHHQSHCAENDKRHPNAEVKHIKDKHYNRQRRLNERRHSLRNKLTKRVDIIGIVGHYIAVGVSVEILYRQLFHLAEHCLSDLIQEALRYDCHYPRMEKCSDNANKINSAHKRNDFDDVRQRRIPSGFDSVIYLNNKVVKEKVRCC